ncbi:MAG: peptidoglycan-binding protein [Hyphomicrobiales bacterium]|nr:peptidoglycan-binding protein [Hyphomicrobiales bacterium]
MTPFRLRLLVVTFAGVAAAISFNALYMQDASRLANAPASKDTDEKIKPPAEKKPPAVKKVPASEVVAIPKKTAPEKPELVKPPPAQPNETVQRQPSEIDAALETVASLGRKQTQSSIRDHSDRDVKIEDEPDGPASSRVIRAIHRELTNFGYNAGPESEVSDRLHTAIVSYEFDMGLPLTGKPSNRLLKSLLFDASASLPSKSARAHFENSRKLIKSVQTILSRMGYGANVASGYLDEATRYAISKFQADRNMAESGRLTARLLIEIVTVTGRPISVPG